MAPLLLDPARREQLVAEHRELPLARPGREGRAAREHSPDLARVLDHFRGRPLAGKLVLVRCAECGGVRIARFVSASQRPQPLGEECYSDLGRAEHAVFLRRVEEFLDERR